MRKLVAFSSIASLLFLGVACKKDDGPDAFARAAIEAVDGKPQAIWNALPPSYQKDVQELLKSFGTSMNEQVWNDGFKVGQKVVKVLETKKEFVLGHPELKGVLKPEDVTKAWDPGVHVLATIFNSDLQTIEGAKNLDVEKFLAGPVASLIEDVVKLGEVAADKLPQAKDAKDLASTRAKLKNAKITVVSSEGDKATIKLEVEGEEPETEEMVKVEGKWIPKDLADSWPASIAKAKASMAMVKVEPEAVVQFNAMKGALDPVLDGLLAAKTQDEFNAQIETAMKAVMGGRPSRPAPPPEEVAEVEKPSKPAKKKAGKKRNR